VILLPPVAYTVKEKQIIDAFEAMPVKSGDYWNDAALKRLKLKIKKHYKTMQGLACCYCRQIITIVHSRAWDTEHIVPRASHALFMFTPLNLAAACPDCNGKKSNSQTLVDPTLVTYPASGKEFHIVHPHFDEYSDHIQRGEYTYIALSDKGTWTVEKCDLARFAGKKFGWPEPIADIRFEEAVDQIQEGDSRGVTAIVSELASAIASASQAQTDPSA
jgi:hypothetical protein